jgi:succinate-semialdehyde dehydrogenase/glutarate-semialdehyde dehydrogenase
VPNGTAADARAAVDAAFEAFPAWRALTGRERANLLKRWHALIVERGDELARTISAEQGKPWPRRAVK